MPLRRVRFRLLLPSAALAIGPLALAACGGSSTGASSSSSTTQGGSTASGSGSVNSTGSTAIIATETEYHIALSEKRAGAGPVTIEANNSGQVTHDLVVNGPAVNNQKTALLSPGQKATLKLTLQAGTYDIYCDIPGHKQAGMDATLTVS